MNNLKNSSKENDPKPLDDFSGEEIPIIDGTEVEASEETPGAASSEEYIEAFAEAKKISSTNKKSPHKKLPLILACVGAFLFGTIGWQDAMIAQRSPMLASIKLSPDFPLNPSFRPDRYRHDVIVAHYVDALEFDAISESRDALVSINDSTGRAGGNKILIPLPVGKTVVKVSVAAAENTGSRTVYEIRVIRSLAIPSWTCVTSAAPWSPRDSALAFSDGKRLYVAGGYEPKLISDCWSSENGRDWQREPEMEVAFNLGATWLTESDLFAIGVGGELLRKNLETQEQIKVVNSHSEILQRKGVGTAVWRGQLWGVGGAIRKSGALMQDIWTARIPRHDAVPTWQRMSATPSFSPREFWPGGLAVFQGDLWVVGGFLQHYSPFCAFNDVWRSSDGESWKQVALTSAWEPRWWAQTVVYRNHLWVIGGYVGGGNKRNLGDVWYSRDGIKWRQLKAPISWSPRHAMSAVIFDDSLWILGGNSWPLKNDVWKLTISGISFLSSPPVETFQGVQYRYELQADFGNDPQVFYRLIDHPSWLRIVEDERGHFWLAGTPSELGEFPVTVEAKSAAGDLCTQQFSISVLGIP